MSECPVSDNRREDVVILGAGLAGLSAGHALAEAGLRAALVEAGATVGGMSRTEIRDGYRFDLGGHRFFTTDGNIKDFVNELMGAEMLTVPRKSRIYLRNKYFEYPLKPLNALFGLGWAVTAKILIDYGLQRLKGALKKGPDISLEDRVVSDFGRTLFNLYFKEYSEKVWGLTCDRISSEWVTQRIKGLSLGVAVKNALFKVWGSDLPTLADHFSYPSGGIGRIAERLLEDMGSRAALFPETRVTGIHHRDFRVERVEARNHHGTVSLTGGEYISTIPLSSLVRMIRPEPPEEVTAAASQLRYRDLVVVAIPVSRERVTDLTWLYFPERDIPFGRLHEPKNWSPLMAGEGKTVLVVEYFCFAGDDVWTADDEDLTGTTVAHLEKLGLIDGRTAGKGCVIRVPKAYPLFEVGYETHVRAITDYLDRFRNLHTVGRGGLFRYYNMDHAIKSGLEAARRILAKRPLCEEVSEPVAT
jgi:protoporphyrinogen oxidase